jgi:hypothetical protein
MLRESDPILDICASVQSNVESTVQSTDALTVETNHESPALLFAAAFYSMRRPNGASSNTSQPELPRVQHIPSPRNFEHASHAQAK